MNGQAFAVGLGSPLQRYFSFCFFEFVFSFSESADGFDYARCFQLIDQIASGSLGNADNPSDIFSPKSRVITDIVEN